MARARRQPAEPVTDEEPDVKIGIQRERHRSCPGIADLWRRGRLTDCVIVVEGEHFEAHRVVLAAHSEYFLRLFVSSFTDAASATVVLETLPAPAFAAFLEWAYRGELELGDAESIAPLLSAAAYLQAAELSNSLVDVVIKLLSPETLANTWLMATAGDHAAIISATPLSTSPCISMPRPPRRELSRRSPPRAWPRFTRR